MKLPENLDPSLRRWDAWRAFHWGCAPVRVHATSGYGSPPFVIFETGEVVATQNAMAPDVRAHYGPLNMSLVSTTDTSCPRLMTPDGHLVPSAWLTQDGMQNLLVDYCTKRVVAVAGTQNPVWAQVCPARFVTSRDKDGRPVGWRIRAWIPGEGQHPVGSGLIDLSIPASNKIWVTPEQQEHVATIVAVCNATMALKNITRGCGSVGLPFERVLAVSEFGELTGNEQLTLFQGGVKRKLVQFDHLVLAP